MQPGDVSLFACITAEYAVEGHSPSYQSAEAFNKLLRERAEPRGARFSHDHPDTCMYIERSKNLNVVAYTANLMAGGVRVESGVGRACDIKTDDPIHAYFINIEPSYLEERRRKGIAHDCDDLKVHERMFAYGCNVSPLSSVITTAAATAGGRQTQWLTKLHHGATEAIAQPAKVNELKWVVDPTKAAAILAEAMPPAAASSDGSNAAAEQVSSWWCALKTSLCHFVALPTWPGVLLCLPPVEDAGSADATETTAAEPDADGAKAEPSPAASVRAAPQDTLVVILSVVDHKLSILNRVYVKSIEPKRFYQLPSVEYIEAFGTSLETGEPTYEKKMNT